MGVVDHRPHLARDLSVPALPSDRDYDDIASERSLLRSRENMLIKIDYEVTGLSHHAFRSHRNQNDKVL